MYHPQIVRAVQNYVDQDKDGEGVGEQGGVMNSQFFGWGVGPPLCHVPDVFRLSPFKHELHFR